MTAPVMVGPSPQGAGPAPSGPPTLEQLLILVARAERKGGLDYTEGDRLRAGLHHLAGSLPVSEAEDLRVVELQQRCRIARQRASRWKQRAMAARSGRGAGPAAGDDSEDARDALARVVELATRWTHIPAKRQAGMSVLAAIRNRTS